MTNQYKYISKPYSLDELINGHPIFKVYCDFFNDLHDWEQEQNISIFENSVTIDHLELIFNEFLNFLSLLIYDKSTYNDTLKKISLKCEELDNFTHIASIIPYILENIESLSDSKISEKAHIHLSKTKRRANEVEFEIDENLHKIAENYIENIQRTLTESNLHDLTFFFDLYRINLINIFSSEFLGIGKRKGNPNEFISNKPLPIKSLDTSVQILLFEQLMKIENWEQISSTKKGQLLSLLIGKNESNIKKIYLELEKKPSFNNKKILADREKTFQIIKEILG